ncbi:hypothetical protein [Pseudomonas typographi]|uniref:hypothetical protein n=1 Tax=Pseudomonas typographi TaxID=2715964 RepID=UPI001684022C|nr:hypothetical protein [Pseudomonas typographi]MBD1554763.1 hypothetical protein [Pseudomonas typographi]
MKVFRSTPLDDETAPASGATGYGHTYDTDTATELAVYWTRPNYHSGDDRYEGMRKSDGKVMGVSFYSDEASGKTYLSTVYTAVAGDSAGAATGVDVRDQSIATSTSSPRYGDERIIFFDFSGLTYTLIDYTSDTPTILHGDATALLGDGQPYHVQMADGSRVVSVVTSYSGQAVTVNVSSIMDGSALTVAASQQAEAPSVVLDFDDPTQVLQVSCESPRIFLDLLRQLGTPSTMDGLLVAYVPAYSAVVIGNYGTWARSGFGDDDQLMLQMVSNDAEGVNHLYYGVTDADGTLSTNEVYDAPTGVLTQDYTMALVPSFTTVVPVIPDFWRGFLKTFETI